MKINTQLLAEVTAFLNIESDMLDHKQYDQWLDLWSESGLYIVPVDHGVSDHKNTLNVAYDDAEMRKLRTVRLMSGEALSTQGASKTVRTLSRTRILAEKDGLIHVSAAYCLYENAKASVRTYPALLQFILRRHDDSFLIEQKVVEVMKSSQHLTTVNYIF